MALSQIQCLDDNHVNPRTHESKPEFFYCEDQRLALETLLRDGREAFVKFLEARGVRGFLSDLELETLSGLVEPYDPGIELFADSSEADPVPLSLHYWPDLSDTSIPQMDLGWPDTDAYRGVTRTTVYTQPPLEGQVHIKEVVRKMITQAQKVIAVVMDVFTDVDIFRDLLDVSFKKRVSVYILLERTNLPHFLAMCRRANMHTGHLKNIRVRCTAGAEFHTRSCTKVSGRMGHRFMFVDGDKAVSGSYSFTWMSSRLDRNLITVTTGQAVDGFDRLYRFLYASSDAVNLRPVTTELEPEPEPLPQPVVVAPPSAAVARKLYNPKYALVAATNPSPTASAESPKEPQTLEDPKKKRRRRASEEDAPPLHPGLLNLEKAYLIPYLPTWPEPDPASDVIGFINIRDSKKPMQVHLQRSEMFETSQAIKFSSPFSKTEATSPKVTSPSQQDVKSDEVDQPQPAQNKTNTKELEINKTENKTKAKELVAEKIQPAQLSPTPGVTKSNEKAPETILPASAQKSPQPDTIRAFTANNKLTSPSNDLSSNKVRDNGTPQLRTHTDLHPSGPTASPNKGTAPNIRQPVSRNSPQSELFPESNTSKKAEPVSGKESAAVYRTHVPESHGKRVPQLTGDSNSDTEVDSPLKTMVSRTDSYSQPVCMEPERVPTSSAAVRSHFLSGNHHIPVTKAHSSTPASASVSTTSPSSPLTSPSFKTQHQLPSSSSSTSASPIPKPRTVQLLIKDDSSSSSSQVCLVKKPETTTEPAVVHNEPPGQTTPPVKETVERQDNRTSKAAAQTYTDHTRQPKETPHHKESLTFQQTKGKEADGRLDAKVRTQLSPEKKLETQSNNLSNAATVQTQQVISKHINPKTLISPHYEITPKKQSVSGPAEQTDNKFQEKVPMSPEFVKDTNKKAENVKTSKTHIARAHEPQRISYYRLTPHDVGVFDLVDLSKDPSQIPVSPSRSLQLSKDSSSGTFTLAADNVRESKQAIFTPANKKDSVLNAAPQNTLSSFQEPSPKTGGDTNTPEKHLLLQLSDKHVPEFQTVAPERELRSIVSPTRTSTLERFSPCTPTPDSRTPTPDLRPYTPDFRTPTSDISDGYVSTREDSNLSTTSEEYYECSDSPSREPVFEHGLYRNHGTAEDLVVSGANAVGPSTSPQSLDYSLGAGTGDGSALLSERQTLAWADRGSSSFPGKRAKKGESEGTANEENGKGEDKKVRKLSVAGRRAEPESLETDRRDGEEAGRVANRLKQQEDSTETAEKAKEARVPEGMSALNQSATDRPGDRGTAAGESTNEETGLTRLSGGDLKPGKVTSEGEEPDKVPSGKEKVSNQVALRSRAVVRREKLQSSREAEEQKRAPQQDSGSPSSSRPPRPPRPLSGSQYTGARPWVSRSLNQTESKVLEVLEGPPSPRKAPSRPPPPAAAGPAGPAAVRRVVSASHQAVASRQPPSAQGRTRASLTQSQASPQKPQPQSQVVSTLEAQGEEDAKSPFAFTFSKLYNLRGLKDKINKLPAQGKKGSGSSPTEARKSTS